MGTRALDIPRPLWILTNSRRILSQNIDSDSSLPSASRSAISAFIRRGLGLPEEHNPQDHLEGFIAEYLWYFLSLDVSCEEVVRIEPPSFAPTDPGGDGLAIHRIPTGYLMFRLWEIKKCTGDSPVSDTINTAYRQLDTKATEYLARYTTIGQELGDAELADLYSRLIELWIDADPAAAAGVSVAISQDCIPSRCFTTFGEKFPRFINPVRLRGMLAAIGDFPSFAENVRDFVWRAL